MATIREHIRIDRPADDVWKVISDAGAISSWFPGIETSSATGTSRQCTMAGGISIVEDIVTNDDDLRRFQYRIVEGPMPVDYHLGTVDVLEDGAGSLVIYSTEIEPGDAAEMMSAGFAGGLQALKAQLER